MCSSGDLSVEERHDRIGNLASTYDAWSTWFPYIYGRPEETVEQIAELLRRTIGKRLSKGRVLDAGCGVGLTTAALLKSGYEAIGLDVSAQSIQRAKSFVTDNTAQVRFLTGDILELPDECGDSDAVLAMTSVLSHFLSIDDQSAALQSFYRTLRPGGVLMFTHYDYEAMMSCEADETLSKPRVTNCDDGSFVYLQKRIWSGKPRNRHYKTKYYKMTLDEAPEVLEVAYLATPIDEVTELLGAIGFEAVQWFSPVETGYFKHACVATKPPTPMRHFVSCGDFEKAETAKAEGRHLFYPDELDINPFEELPDYSLNTLRQSQSQEGTVLVERRRQSTLVMFSGGIDSVYVLQRLLRESDDEIVAHHIHFVNLERRHEAEEIACRKIVSYLRETERDFFYTESVIDRRRFRAFGMDDMAVGFEVGIVHNSMILDRGEGFDRWTSGTCLEEELEYYGEQEVERFENVLNCVQASCYPNEPPRFFQLKIIPKRDQMEYMGSELVDLCWTCRRPVWSPSGQPSECGTCKTCGVMNKIRRGERTVPSRQS